ncbi:MAG: deoxyribodipyrimidine photo-lyase, partial [Bacteroidota bacterium]|nr:deoxyribodipyrimidine photo-lyase [Bacteroidota bacterium]
MKDNVIVFWFRRDLRLDDNVGLYQALQNDVPVLPIFIFDKEILENLPKNDARVNFIHEQLQKINNKLRTNFDSGIAQFHDTPKKVFQQLLDNFQITAVYTNHDYEPYAKKRDAAIKSFLEEN